MPATEFNRRDSYVLRSDLHESLTHSHIDPSRLSTFQRILLTTDGTVTEILEAYLFERHNDPSCLFLRFEDLVGEQGGGSFEQQKDAIK